MNDFSSSFMMIVGCAFLAFYCLRTLILSGIDAYKEILMSVHRASKEIDDVKRGYVPIE
jgi:GTP1/Obg family GTP-binding protein